MKVADPTENSVIFRREANATGGFSEGSDLVQCGSWLSGLRAQWWGSRQGRWTKTGENQDKWGP